WPTSPTPSTTTFARRSPARVSGDRPRGSTGNAWVAITPCWTETSWRSSASRASQRFGRSKPARAPRTASAVGEVPGEVLAELPAGRLVPGSRPERPAAVVALANEDVDADDAELGE